MSHFKSNYDNYVVVISALLLFCFWDSLIVYPLKICVVFFHEMSHALMTLITGGQVKEFAINSNQSGHVISQGGNRFLILSAGYLGSLLVGALIYIVAVKTDWDRYLLFLLAAIMAWFGFMSNGFGLLFNLLFVAFLLWIAIYLEDIYCDLMLRIIGVSNLIYVPQDIFSDTIMNASAKSDANMLADEIGGATMLWGGVWLGISFIVIIITLFVTYSRPEKIPQ